MFWEGFEAGGSFEDFERDEWFEIGESGGVTDLQVEVEVGAQGFVLMDLDGDGVFAGDEVVGLDQVAMENAFVEAHGDVVGDSLRSDLSFGETAADDFFSVDEDEGTVVATEVEKDGGGDFFKGELVTEPRGDSFVAGVASVVEFGGFLAVAIAEGGGALFPGGRVEGGEMPVNRGSLAVVPVVPD